MLFHGRGPFRAAAFAAVGLRPMRSGNRCFYGTRSPAGSCRAATEGPFQSAEAENTVKRFSRRTGVNLQYFRLEPTPLGSERGEQPLSRCGERGVQRERGGSRNTPLTLWPSGATPAAMHLAKGIRPALRDHPLCGKRRFRIASALLWQSQRKNYFLFAFGRVAAPSVCRGP